MAGPSRESLAEKLERHRVVRDGCWAWNGAKHPFGYGWLRHGSRTLLAHRVAFEVAHGLPMRGIVVRHACDTPECTNPDHLIGGTHADNVADRFARGRHVRPDGCYANTKITPEQIAQIGALLTKGMSYRAVGRSLGFSGCTIKRHAQAAGAK